MSQSTKETFIILIYVVYRHRIIDRDIDLFDRDKDLHNFPKIEGNIIMILSLGNVNIKVIRTRSFT